jgi:hypothetical protein
MTIDPGGEKFANKRAIRRHHRQRIISKRYERVVRGAWFVKSPGRLGKTNTVCSCWMCGNPRKYFGLVTRREILADEVQGKISSKERLSRKTLNLKT